MDGEYRYGDPVLDPLFSYSQIPSVLPAQSSPEAESVVSVGRGSLPAPRVGLPRPPVAAPSVVSVQAGMGGGRPGPAAGRPGQAAPQATADQRPLACVSRKRPVAAKTKDEQCRCRRSKSPMSSLSAEQMPSPPTYRFRPKKRELVEFYLLPRARGQNPFPGVIFEDDAAGSSLPWDLFERHGVGGEDEAYFIVRSSEAKKPGARQDRACDGGVGTWKMQSSVEKSLRIRGERIKVHVSNLNLHMGKGKNTRSVGWVMHEYSIAAPSCPSFVKICHIAFSGHGQMRMRVPDDQQVCQRSGHACIGATTASGSSALPCSGAMLGSSGEAYASSALPCSGTMLDHGSLGMAYASGDEEPSHLILIDDDNFRQSPFLSSNDFQGLQAAASEVLTTEQHIQQSTVPVAWQLSARELEFWSSIGVDVQSSNSFDQEQVHSSWVAGDLDDFCRSVLTNVQTNCAALDFGNMATGTLGGGCSLLCK